MTRYTPGEPERRRGENGLHADTLSRQLLQCMRRVGALHARIVELEAYAERMRLELENYKTEHIKEQVDGTTDS